MKGPEVQALYCKSPLPQVIVLLSLAYFPADI